MAKTMIPMASFRWFVDHNGDRILQQRFGNPSGQDEWIDVPEVSHWEKSTPTPAARAEGQP